MASVYSVNIYEAAGLVGSAVLGPPPGFRWVIRDVAAYASAGLSAADLHIEGPLGQTFYFFHCPASSTTYDHKEMRVVVFEGQSITVNTDNPIDVTISGYELSVP